jgi:hypothetical protein
VDDLTRDPLGLSSEEEVGVGRSGGRIADDEEGNVDGRGVLEDRVGFEFDELSGG